MTPTDLSEMSLELKIASDLTGLTSAEVKAAQSVAVAEAPVAYDAEWVLGDPHDYDRQHVVDTRQLLAFLERTQPEVVAALNIGQPGSSRTKFLERVQSEVAKRGVVDVLRKGIRHGPESITLYFQTPTAGNQTAIQRFRDNIFSVTRQLRYSLDETRRALDLALFINGLPVATLELKNQITNQNVTDAIDQYMKDRSPKEKLFQFGVCAVHFAVDDNEVWFTTRLDEKRTLFLPFNKGYQDGAGNPPNPAGIKTGYLWHDVLRRASLANLIENFITRIEEKNEQGRKISKLIFPRYHQLDVVRKLLADAHEHGVGRKYLIQHSAGSGKSNSISWLAWQLIELNEGGKALFDTVLIVTDRRALDSQLSRTVKAMGQSGWAMSHADASVDLGTLIHKGQRIITTTVQKFPFIADTIGSEHRDRTFAIIIDEAHSSQGGRASAKLNATLARDLDIVPDEDGGLTFEDQILIAMRERKMLTNASYFAFTATPKNRTLEMFGERIVDHLDGTPKFVPFHTYTMKQAIDERFILDVLQNYTPYRSFYKLVKTVEDDPEFDRTRARRKLHHYVESHPDTVRQKAEIIVDHFSTQVIAKGKVGGEARAMVVTSSIKRAIEYWRAIKAALAERKSPYRAIVAFSGEQEIDGRMVTESHLNGFPSSHIPDMLKTHPYRLLVVADKFQTGFDEPLLHTMYVDKPLSSVKAVQTLSRLNRAHPAKSDTFVLDFFNDPDEIEAAFQPFYRTTVLSGESDPNKLHELQAQLDDAGVYTAEQVTEFVQRYIAGEDIALLHPSLDRSREIYESDLLDEEERIAFKGGAKAFVRTYSFLSAILPYTNAEWEERSIFLKFLIPKLPAPDDPDLAKGILEAIDMESYRVEAQQTMQIALEDEDGSIDPPPTGDATFQAELELDRLSSILETFNDLFADAGFTDEDRIKALNNINGPIMDTITGDSDLEATLNSGDVQNTQIQFNKSLEKALTANIQSNVQVYKKQQEDRLFRQHLEALVYDLYKTRVQGQDRPGII
jgi:type I restriction enzyme R subunit